MNIPPFQQYEYELYCDDPSEWMLLKPPEWIDRRPKEFAKGLIGFIAGISIAISLSWFALAFFGDKSLTMFVCTVYSPLPNAVMLIGALLLLIPFHSFRVTLMFIIGAALLSIYYVAFSALLLHTDFGLCKAKPKEESGPYYTRTRPQAQKTGSDDLSMGYAGIAWNVFSIVMNCVFSYIVVVASNSLDLKKLEERKAEDARIQNYRSLQPAGRHMA